jgi:hypothetical protein
MDPAIPNEEDLTADRRRPFAVRLAWVVTFVVAIAGGLVLAIMRPWQEEERVRSSPSTAMLRFEPSELTLDDSAGVQQTVSVLLKNEGSFPIDVVGVETSCGCSEIVGETAGVLNPGESREVNLTIQMPTYGERVVRVQALTADEGAPETSLTIRTAIAHVRRVTNFSPAVFLSDAADRVKIATRRIPFG